MKHILDNIREFCRLECLMGRSLGGNLIIWGQGLPVSLQRQSLVRLVFLPAWDGFSTGAFPARRLFLWAAVIGRFLNVY